MTQGNDTKTRVKRAVKRAALFAGGIYRARGARILTYHSVGVRDHDMNVAPDDFLAQMQWLKANCHVVSLHEAVANREGVAITFDDGYRDNRLFAAPCLKSLDLPATFFIVAGRLGEMLAHDKDPATSTLMTWEEVQELESMGFEIGCHTMSHARLSHLSEEAQRQEIVESARLLETRLGHFVSAFAYPFGSADDYTPVTMRLVRDAGFRFALSNRYGVNGKKADRWALKRIWIDCSDDLEMFQAKLSGRLDALALLDSQLGLWGRSTLNRLAGR